MKSFFFLYFNRISEAFSDDFTASSLGLGSGVEGNNELIEGLLELLEFILVRYFIRLEVLVESLELEWAGDIGSEPRPVLDGVLDRDNFWSTNFLWDWGGTENEHGSVSPGLLVVSISSRDPVQGILEGGWEGEVVIWERDDDSVVLEDFVDEVSDFCWDGYFLLSLNVDIGGGILFEILDSDIDLVLDKGSCEFCKLLVDWVGRDWGPKNEHFFPKKYFRRVSLDNRIFCIFEKFFLYS